MSKIIVLGAKGFVARNIRVVIALIDLTKPYIK